MSTSNAFGCLKLALIVGAIIGGIISFALFINYISPQEEVKSATRSNSFIPPATPNLIESRQMYCGLFQDQFAKYSLSSYLDGPDQDILVVHHREKSVVIFAYTMILSKDEIFQQLKQLRFRSIHFTDGKKYNKNIPIH